MFAEGVETLIKPSADLACEFEDEESGLGLWLPHKEQYSFLVLVPNHTIGYGVRALTESVPHCFC